MEEEKVSLLTFDDGTDPDKPGSVPFRDPGYPTLPGSSRLCRDLRGIRAFSAKSRLTFGQKPASLVTLVPVYSRYSRYSHYTGIPGILYLRSFLIALEPEGRIIV